MRSREASEARRRAPTRDAPTHSALPFVDEHTVLIGAPAEVGWDALQRYVAAMCAAERRLLGRLLGAEPFAGFAVAEMEPPRRLTLVGRHRFARY
jgi:hypothetical protein